MHPFVAVIFVEPVHPGQFFARDDWPLHVTVLRFDLPATEEAGEEDAQQELGDWMGEAAGALLGRELRVGPEAWFGRGEDLLVNLVEPDPVLQDFHERLAARVLQAGGRIASVRFTGEGYRPHITHHRGRCREAGQRLDVARVALVDMAPGGEHALRQVLRLFTR